MHFYCFNLYVFKYQLNTFNIVELNIISFAKLFACKLKSYLITIAKFARGATSFKCEHIVFSAQKANISVVVLE